MNMQNSQLMKLSLMGSIAIALVLLYHQLETSWLLAALVCGAGLMIAMSRVWVIYHRQSGLPINAVDRTRLMKLSLASESISIRQALRGHDETVKRICRSIDSSLKLADPSRCLGTFFLVGPTGTGKTYLAELISQALYPSSEQIIIRLNQYKDSADVQALIGSVETGEPGLLTSALMENPYRVVLFDEIDKAHPDVLDALYDILDTACTHDKVSGNLISFAGCVFLATCNQGVEELRAIRGESDAVWIGKARDALGGRVGFERAFLARWDQIFLMDELPAARIAEVTCLGISRFWRSQGMSVAFSSPELVLSLVKANREFSQYGVRQLQQLIRARSDRVVLEAREAGFKRVLLDIESDGRMKVRRAA